MFYSLIKIFYKKQIIRYHMNLYNTEDKSASQRVIFLDCGTRLGEGFAQILELYNISKEKLEVFMFEPNKHSYNIAKSKNPGYKIFNKAVWNKDEQRILNIQFEPREQAFTGGAANIIQDNFVKPAWVSDSEMTDWPPKTSEVVDCINLSNFILENFNPSDFIYMKLDIEGAEIEVLDKLIEDGTIKYINKVFVEWHFHTRKQTEKSKEYYLNIFEQNNIQYNDWV